MNCLHVLFKKSRCELLVFQLAKLKLTKKNEQLWCYLRNVYVLSHTDSCIIGVLSISVLHFEPGRNTTFLCIHDSETGATFSVDGKMYLVDQLPQGVEFVNQKRSSGENAQVVFVTTVIFGVNLNGSVVRCCFVNETHTACRESFLLVCSANEGNH